MSSTESSGAPAEASATTPAPAATFPTFGSTRGSGLARGKRPAASPAATTAASTGYTPTAIEVINAPREYQNPFAPAETPAAASPEPVARVPAESAVPAPVALVAPTPVVAAPAPVVESAPAVAAVAPAPVQNEAPAELNILEPEQPKAVHAQTWESEGFRPARERSERPRRDERAPREERAPRSEQPAEPVDLASIPEKFLYVRPGYNYVPTPTNYGGAPRERSERPAHGSPERAMETSSVAAEAPAKSGGFLGWLKSLFGGSPAAPAATGTPAGEPRYEGGQRRHRGGRNRGGQGGGYQGGGEGGGQRRSRGGRGRGGERGGYRGERSGGGDAGPSAT